MLLKMDAQGDRVPFSKLLREFAAVADSLEAVDVHTGEGQIASLSVTERGVLTGLVTDTQARLAILGQRLALEEVPVSPDFVEPNPDATVPSDTDLDTDNHSPNQEIPTDNGHREPMPGLLGVMGVPPIETANAFGAVAETPGADLPTDGTADADPGTTPVPAAEETKAPSPAAEPSGVEVLRKRQTEFARLTPSVIGAHEARMADQRTRSASLVFSIDAKPRTVTINGHEVTLRMRNDGSTNDTLEIVNALLEELVIKGRPEVLTQEIAAKLGIKLSKVVASYSKWARTRFSLTTDSLPFLVERQRDEGDRTVIRANPDYVFADQRTHQPDATNPEQDEPSNTAAVEQPDGTADVESDETLPAAAELARLGHVQLTKWGLEWTTKDGESAVRLNGQAIMGMNPLMADSLALVAQYGGVVGFSELHAQLKRKYPDLKPTELLGLLTATGDLLGRYEIGHHYTNQIARAGDSGPARVISLAGTLPIPEDHDFLAQLEPSLR